MYYFSDYFVKLYKLNEPLLRNIKQKLLGLLSFFYTDFFLRFECL